MRIRGKIGDWPVDLTVELESHEWAQLAGRLVDEAPVTMDVARAPAAPQAPKTDELWATSLMLLRNAGHVDGPQLLTQLVALAGSEMAGKRILVRMRHSAQVRVESGIDAPVYHWAGDV